VLAAFAAAARYDISFTLRSRWAVALLAAGTLVEVAALQSDPALQLMLIVTFGAVIVGAASDAACGYVFDALTLPCLLIVCAMSLLAGAFAPFALGAAACGGSLVLLYLLTRRRGLGLGDVKLACCIGGACGALGGIEALGIAFVLGGTYAFVLLATKRAQRGKELRFAPYMAAGMAIVVMHGVF
jgi:leader peptidase (prepilin peptidase)/N-methyltransferase